MVVTKVCLWLNNSLSSYSVINRVKYAGYVHQCVCGVRVPQTQAELILSLLHPVSESIRGVIS